MVSQAKLPDGCGRNTKTAVLTAHSEYTIPAGNDGAVFAASYPLTSTAAAAQIGASRNQGGLTTIPTLASDFAVGAFQYDQWDNWASFRAATSFARDTYTIQKPWRVMGFNMVVNTSDAVSDASGRLYGGQIPYHPLKVGANAGGWFTGNGSFAAGDSVQYAHLIDSLIGFGSSNYSAADGITVRLLMDDQYNRFACTSKLPNRFLTVPGADGDYSAGTEDYNVADIIGQSGRHDIPVVVLKNANAGSHWVCDVALVIEYDYGFQQLDVADQPEPSPYSDKLPYLLYRSRDLSLYPATTKGHSFWPVVNTLVGKAGNAIFTLAKKQIKKAGTRALEAALE